MKLLHFIIIFSLIILLYYFYNTPIFEGFSNNPTVSCSIGKQFIKDRDMIIAVSYGPSLRYNVKKDQVNNVMIKIQREYPHAKLCSRSDIQMLVNKKKPYCFCGWVKGPSNVLSFGDYITLNNKYKRDAYLSIVGHYYGHGKQGYKLQTFTSPTYRLGGGIFHITSAVGKKGPVENNDLVYLENKGNQGNGQGGYLSVRTDLPGNCVTSRDFQAYTLLKKNSGSIWKIRIPHNDNNGIKIKKNDSVIFISMDQNSRKIKEMPYMLATCNWVRWPIELGISVRRQSGVGGGGSDVQWQIQKLKNMKNDMEYHEKNIMGNYQSVYPSTRSTRSGCGGGAQRIINCGNISWAGGKSGVYVKLSGKANEVISKLKNQGLAARVVWKSNKCYPITYNNNFNVQTLKKKSIWFTTGKRGVNDYNIKGISLELAMQMANKNIYAIEYNPHSRWAIFRSYTSDGKVPPIKISYANSWNLNLIPSRWNGKDKGKAKTSVGFSPHVGDSIYSRKGVNNTHIRGIRLDDAKSLIKDNTYAIVYKEKSGEAFLYSYDKNNKPPNDIDISEDKNSVVYTIDGRYQLKEPIIDPFKYQQDKSVSSYISPLKEENNLDNYVIYDKPQKFNDRKCNMNIKKNCFNEEKYIDNNLGIWKNRGDGSWNYFGKEKDVNVLNFEYNDVKKI